MRNRENITHEKLLQLIKYNKSTGIFIRRRTGLRTGFVNSSNGFRAIELEGKRYTEPRLAVFYVNGQWPEGKVQHKGKSRRVTKFIDLSYQLPAMQPPGRFEGETYGGTGTKIRRFNPQSSRTLFLTRFWRFLNGY